MRRSLRNFVQKLTSKIPLKRKTEAFVASRGLEKRSHPIKIVYASRARRGQARDLGQSGRNLAPDTSKSPPVMEKYMLSICFYPQGVHIIGVLALGPILSTLIFHRQMVPKSALFPTVSDSLKRLPKVSDGFRGSPRVLDGFRRFPDGFRCVACMQEKNDHGMSRKNDV